PRERLDRGVDGGELLRRQIAEARREPGGAARADAAQDALAVLGQGQPDAPAVGLARRARDEAVALEPVDVVRHRGWRDTLIRSELADADPRGVLDRDEERDLLGRDADLPGLAPELPPDLKEDRP